MYASVWEGSFYYPALHKSLSLRTPRTGQALPNQTYALPASGTEQEIPGARRTCRTCGGLTGTVWAILKCSQRSGYAPKGIGPGGIDPLRFFSSRFPQQQRSRRRSSSCADASMLLPVSGNGHRFARLLIGPTTDALPLLSGICGLLPMASYPPLYPLRPLWAVSRSTPA